MIDHLLLRNKSSKKDSISYGQVLHFVYQILLLFNVKILRCGYWRMNEWNWMMTKNSIRKRIRTEIGWKPKIHSLFYRRRQLLHRNSLGCRPQISQKIASFRLGDGPRNPEHLSSSVDLHDNFFLISAVSSRWSTRIWTSFLFIHILIEVHNKFMNLEIRALIRLSFLFLILCGQGILIFYKFNKHFY